MVSQPLKYFDETVTDPWLKSLNESRRLAARQGCGSRHRQLVIFFR